MCAENFLSRPAPVEAAGEETDETERGENGGALVADAEDAVVVGERPGIGVRQEEAVEASRILSLRILQQLPRFLP